MIANSHSMSHTFPQSNVVASSRAWSLLNGGTGDESAPSLTAPFPSSHCPPSAEHRAMFDPALCVTPERKPSSVVPLRHPVPSLSEEDDQTDHRSTKVHFDQTVSVHHLSPEDGGNSDPDDHLLYDSNSDELTSRSYKLNLSDSEPISIIASDLRSLTTGSASLLRELQAGKSVTRSRTANRKAVSDSSKKEKCKARSGTSVLPQVIAEYGSSEGIWEDSFHTVKDPKSTVEPDCVLARPELNSTLRMSSELTSLQAREFDVSSVVKEKINPKLKQQVFEKACLKVNQENVVYPDLISLEVSEADLLSKISDEQAKLVRPTDTASDKCKPEEKISRVPDVMDFFTADLQKESASVNLVAIPAFQLVPQTAELDHAFDLYRHIRTWENL